MSTNEVIALKARIAALEAELAVYKSANKAEKTVKVEKAAFVATPELKARVLAAITSDTVKDERGYYKSYTGHFIIGNALKKYGDKAEIKDNTWLAAAKDYAIIK